MNNEISASEFWSWFKTNNHKYLFLPEIDQEEKDLFLEEFLNELHKFCDQLYFEIGADPQADKVDLVITADGNLEYFPKVEELVDAAPLFENWSIVKFRQPHNSTFTTQYVDKLFNPEETIFIPLSNDDMPDAIGLQVCYPDYEEEEHDTFIHGTFIMLDTLIGEESTALNIDYLEVAPVPEDIDQYDVMRVSEIAKYIAEIKSRS